MTAVEAGVRQAQPPPQGASKHGGKISKPRSDEHVRSNQPNPKAIDNNHQKSVQGKNQHGPNKKVGRGAGGNQGSKGQNVSRHGSQREEASGKQHRTAGDVRA